MQRHFTEN